MEVDRIIHGDCLEVLKTLDGNSIDCCVTSPPYWGLRDYGVEGQLGLENTPEEYIEKLVSVFREVKRVLKREGTLWLNLGDSYSGSMKGIGSDGTAYAGKKQVTNRGSVGIYHEKPPSTNAIGLKPKNLIGIPWHVAFALQADGWYLRSDIIWHKPNPMPESVRDRPTKAHEYIFLMSKSSRYYYDQDSVREKYIEPINRWGGQHIRNVKNKSSWDEATGQLTYRQRNMRPNSKGRNKRTVWTVSTKPFREAHFATFPPDLIKPCILAGCPSGGLVLDPFFGAGTTGLVAMKAGRHFIGIELNEEYIEIAKKRLNVEQMQLGMN